MSIQLDSAYENARLLIDKAIEPFADGRLFDLDLAIGLGTLFRMHGTCATLIRGVADPLFSAQMQSASVYAFALARTSDEQHKATSAAGCLWDAMAGQYWEAARQIAGASRRSHNPNREHEDDFCYVFFLMHRYLRGADAPAPSPTDQMELDTLARWETVLNGELDPRLDLCHALRDRELDRFEQAIISMAEARHADLQRRFDKGKLTSEDFVWVEPIWPEGLALLRLAAAEGLAVEHVQVPRVPPLLRTNNPYRFDPNAWRSLDFSPQTW